MFTLDQISEAHKSVKSGADFPKYAQALIKMGVTAYDTFVFDGHAIYFGNPEPLISLAKYEKIEVAQNSNKEKFIQQLRIHQNGGSDYMTFCRDCAENGVEKWTLNMKAGTCTYYDTKGEIMIVEHFPIS